MKPLFTAPRRSAGLTLSQRVVLALAVLLAAASTQAGAWLDTWRKDHPVWRGAHVMLRSAKMAEDFVTALPKLKAEGLNVLIFEINYGFAFDSHPELRAAEFLTRAQVGALAHACRQQGIRPIPQFSCLGHQSWAKSTFPLLTKYPELDETPGQYPENKDIYCRSWCPQHPQVNGIVFPLLDELIAAFDADAFHVGMDEVFLLASEHCPRCKGGDPAKLYAKAVNDLHRHLVGERKVEMLMWGDRFLDTAKLGFGEWEAAKNGTAPAVDLVPKDIVLCDWHYEELGKYPGKPTDYTSAGFLAEKGFRVWPSGWRNAQTAAAFSASAKKLGSPKILGYLVTTWGAVKPLDLAEWPPLKAGFAPWK